ncbi:MAG: transglycosylase SLT domain-containing protein [Nitrospirota bacterium]|nr:transglycosylase SLT domain-containing protein [Nitrospirota bacterium]
MHSFAKSTVALAWLLTASSALLLPSTSSCAGFSVGELASLAPSTPIVQTAQLSETPEILPPPEVIDEPETPSTPLEINLPPSAEKAVQHKIDRLSGAVRETFSLWLARSGKYISIMQEVLEQKGMPTDLVFLPLIESGFDPFAVSSRSAAGPWQFMAGTAEKYGLKINWWTDERRDPVKATKAAADYLKRLHEMFGSWPLALASYNAGEGRVSRAMSKANTDDFWQLHNTRLLPKQTRDYVPLYLAAATIAKEPEKHGFEPTELKEFRFDEVLLHDSLSLPTAASCAGTTVEKLRELNPALKRNVTPPYKNYILRIPKGTKASFQAALEQLSPDDRRAWNKVKVKKGDSFWSLAQKYRLSVDTFKEINSLEGKTRLKVGDYVLVPKDGTMHTVSRKSSKKSSRKS